MIPHRILRTTSALLLAAVLLAGCATQSPPTSTSTSNSDSTSTSTSSSTGHDSGTQATATQDASKQGGMNEHFISNDPPKIYPVNYGADGEKPREDGLTEAPYTMDGDVKVFNLKMVAVKWKTAEGKEFEAWTFNGHVPGPVIRVTEGDKVRIVVENLLSEGTGVHWHGLDVPNKMDGVPMVTQDPILPGQKFTYEFTVNQYGTNMYHAHHDDLRQITNGLFGPMIIDPKDPSKDPKVDHDVIMMIGDGALGYTINGKTFPDTTPFVFKKGEKVRVRYLNIGNQVHPMHMHGFNVQLVAKDGNMMPQPWWKINTVDLLQGDLYDVVVTLDRPGVWAWHCHNIGHVDDGHGNMTGLVQVVKVEE
jgi:FtsP/CotA-like multicopper oxidase with cupredoxin domain